jgi:hypothetical protein
MKDERKQLTGMDRMNKIKRSTDNIYAAMLSSFVLLSVFHPDYPVYPC